MSDERMTTCPVCGYEQEVDSYCSCPYGQARASTAAARAELDRTNIALGRAVGTIASIRSNLVKMQSMERKPGPLDGITLLDIAHAFEWSFDSDFESLMSEGEVATREKFRAILSEALSKDVVPGDGLIDLAKALLGVGVPEEEP